MISRRSLILPFLLLAYSCMAWGPTGHRVTGTIAEQHLSSKARKNIQKILGHEALAIASTWMDEVRSDTAYDHTRDWHWVTIPDGQTYAQTEKNPKGDLIEAIERMKVSLRDPGSSPLERRRDLRFLVHLIGDLHQPLHVGRGDDRGGNTFKVKWMRSNSNLHRVWDSDMIELQQLSYTELAASLEPVTTALKSQWQRGSIADWAHEAMTYREQIYSVEPDAEIGYEYGYRNWDLVRLQLLKGGVRLAGVLNEIFG